MAKQTFTTGQVLTAAQMTSLQQTAMGGGAATAKTASYVLVAADAGTTVAMNAAGATTITVNTGLFAAGDTVFIQNLGAGACTVTAGTATVATAGSLILPQNDAGILYFTSASAAIFYDYIQAGAVSPLTTKGDLYGFSTLDARIPIGANGTLLTADSSESLGLKWAAPAAAGGGLDFISTTSFSAVSSQSVNDVFSATYDNYVIKLNNCTAAGDLFVHMRMRVGGVDTSTNYRYQNVQADNTTVTASRSTSATHFSNIGYVQTAFNNDFTFSLTNPFNTKPTSGFSNLTTGASGNIEFNSTGYGLNDSTSYTGFTLITSTSNMTGSVSVYGYKK